MAKRVRVAVEGVLAEAALFEEQAPRTVEALWARLPIRDRTMQARWSGDGWRTEGNYELIDREAAVENPAERLAHVERCQRILFEGPLSVEIARLGD